MTNVERTLLPIALVLALPTMASAQATLITGLGGPLDFGTNVLARGDDTSSAEIDVTPVFGASGFFFFGRHYTSLFVNTNGSVSFGGPIGTYTPSPFPFPACSTPMVAPWWGDVDTRAPLTTDAHQNLVYWSVDAVGHRFVATWTEVGYFDQHDDRLNSFQLVLTPDADGRTFDVEMRYARCEWTTGDASGGTSGLGGTPAQAGFDAADGMSFLALPGSLAPSVLALCTTSNVGMPGVWQLPGTVTPMCGNGLRETGEACDDGADHTRCDASCHVVVPNDAGLDMGTDDAGADDAGADDAATDDAATDDAATDMGIDVGSSDAGSPCTPRPDAGTRRPDSGTRFDAGVIAFDMARPDGGPPPPPSYDVTGGGCGCRAGGRSHGGAIALAVLGWLVITRTRARAPSRAGTSRRP